MQRQAPIYQVSTPAAPKNCRHGHSPLRTLLAVLALAGFGLLIPVGVGAATYTWTGGGGADTRWTTAANWDQGSNYPGWNANAGADVAQFDAATTVTLDTTLTVTTLTFNSTAMVILTLNNEVLTVTNYLHVGRSSDAAAPAANVTINGPGAISTASFDTNEYQINSLTMNEYATMTIGTVMYGNANGGMRTDFLGDGTATITTPPGGANTQYGIPAFTVSGVTVVSSNMTFSYTPAPGAGLSVTLTANGRFPTNVTYRTPSYYLTRTGAEVWYLNNTTGTDQRAVTYNAFTALPWTPASDNEAFSFRIDFPGTIADGNGIVFNLYQNDRFSQIGTIQYTQGECFWIGEAASGSQTDWGNPLNWSTGLVPDATEDVRIPVTTNKPVLSTSIQTGSVLIQNGASLSLGGNTLDIETVTVENGGTLNLNTGTIEVDSVTIDGTGRMNAGSGTVLFTGAASWNCDQPLYSPLYNLEIDSGATLNINNALFVAGNWVNGGTFTHNSRAVTFNGTANQTVTTGGDSFHTVSITNTGGAIIASGNLTLAGNLAINSGADLDIATNSSPLSVGGTATINGTLTAGTANMTFTGGGSNAGTVTLTGSQTIGGTVLTNTTTSLVEYTGAATPVWGTAYGDLTVSAGTLSVSTDFSCNDLTVAAGGTISHAASNTITASGAVSIQGVWNTPANSSLVMTGNSTLDAAPQLGALTVNNSNTVNLSGNDLSLAGALLIGNGSTLSDAANNLGISVTGTTTVNGTLSCGSGSDSFAAVGGSGTWNVSTGTTSVSDSISTTTVNVTGGTMTLSGGTHGAYSFNNLEIAGSVTSGDDWIINGNLLISSGAWTGGAHSHQVHGDWDNQVGAGGFSSTGTVSFVNDAAGSTHSLTGETSFYNLTSVTPGGATGASTLSLPASTTTTVTNSLTLQGINGYRLNLVSSNPGTQWTLSAPVTQTLDWLAVTDSIRTTNTAAVPTNSTSTNSTGWGIAQVYTWSAAAGNWSEPSNWSPNGVPGAVAGDSVIINSGSPTVDATPGNALASISLNGGALTLAADLSATDMDIGDGTGAAETATLTTDGNNLTVSGTFALNSDGLLVSNGTGTISELDSVAAGSIVRYVAGGGSTFNVTTTGPARNYQNLEVTGGTYTVADAVSAVNLSLSGTGTYNFNGDLDVTGSFSTTATAFNLAITGNGSTITPNATFNNTGTLQLGDAEGDSLTFAGGLDTTAVTGTVSLAGTISSNDEDMVFGAVTLVANTTLDSNATLANDADITLEAVTGNFDLTLETGNGIANANVSGTSFNSTGTLTLQNIGGTAGFTGAVSAGSLSVPNTVVNVALTGTGGIVDTLVEFHNSGTLTLGQDLGTQTYTGGINTTTAPAVGGLVSLNGTIATTNSAIMFGNITLGSTVILDSNAANATGAISVGTVTSSNTGYAFTADATTFGAVSLGAIGTAGAGTDDPASVTVSGSTLSLASVYSHGAQAYTGATSITLNGTNYQTLTNTAGAESISFDGPVILGSNVAITSVGGDANDDITFSASATINDDPGTSDRTLTLDAGIGSVSFVGIIGGTTAPLGITVSDAASVNFGEVVHLGSSGLVISATTSNFAGNILTNIGNPTTAGPVTITGNMTTSGAVTIDTNASITDGVFTVSGTLTATADNLTLDLGTSDFTAPVGSDFGTVIVSSVNDITLNDTNAIILGDIASSGIITVNTTTANATSTITVNGNVGSAATTSITLNTAGSSVAPINLASGGFRTSSGTTTLSDNAILTATGNVTLTDTTLVCAGSLDLDATGTLAAGMNAVQITGNLTRTDGSLTSGGTLIFDGTAQTADFTSSTLNNVTVGDGVDATTLTLESDLSVSGTLSILTNAALTALDSDTVTSWDISTRSWTNNGTFTAAAGTVIFSNTGTLGGSTQTSFATVYFDGDTTFTQSFAATVALAIDSDDSTTGTRILSDGGTNLVITIGGSWTNNDGFTAGDSTVSFTDTTNHTIAGSTTFYNLTMDASGAGAARTLTFTDGTTQTIAAGGSLTLLGTSGQLLTLEGSGTGGWTIDLQNTATTNVQFVDVSYGNADTNSIAAATSRDSGNNDTDTARWVFTPASIRWTGTDSGVWGLGTNWQYGYVPNVTDNVIFQTAGVTSPLDASGLDATTARVNDVTITGGTINASGAGTIRVDGDITVSGTPTFSAPGNLTWDMRGSGSTLSGVTAINIGNIRIDPGATNSITLGADTQVNNLLLQSGTLAANTRTLSIRGNISDNTNAGELTFTSGTLTLNGAVAQSVDLDRATLSNLTVDNSYATSPQVSANASISLSGNLALNGGTLAMGTNQLSLTGATSSITNDGIDGPLATNGGVLTSTGTISFEGTGAQIADLRASILTGATISTASKASGSLSFPWGFTVGTFTTVANNYDISFNANTGSGGEATAITNTSGTSFLNRGILSIGNEDFDSITVSGGITATSASGTNSFRGTLATNGFAGQNIALDDLGISGGTLTLDAGAAGTISVTGATTGAGYGLTIANSNGASFTGAVGSNGNALGTVTITNTSNGQTVAFNGGLYTSTLSTAAQAYNLSIGAGAGNQTSVVGSLAGGTAGYFNHSGTLVLGNTDGDSITFTSGVANASSVSGIQLAGTIASTGTMLNLNDNIILNANTTLSSGTGALTAGGTVNSSIGNTYSLTLNSTGITTLGAAGATDALLSLTTDANGSTSLQSVRTSQSISIGDNVTVNGTLTVSSAGYGVTLSGTTTLAAGSGTITLTGDNADNDITFTGAVNGAQALNLTATGGDILFSSTVGDSQPLTGITVNAANTLRFNNTLDLGTSGLDVTATNTYFANNVSTSGGGNITFNGASNLTASAALSIDTNDTVDGTLSFGTGTLTATTGTLTLDLGTSDFTAPSGSNFGTVIITNVNDITLNDTNGIILGTSTIGGTLAVNAGGTITDSGDLSITGTTTLSTSTAAVVTLDAANNFGGAVTANGSITDLTLNDTGAIRFASIDISGNMVVTAAGQIDQTGAILVDGTSSLTAGNANDITLNNTSNNFGNTVTVISGNNVTLVDTDAISLGNIAAAGTIDIRTYTDNAASTIMVAGTIGTATTPSIDLDTATNAATASVAPINLASGSFTTNGGTVTLEDRAVLTGATFTLNAPLDCNESLALSAAGSIDAGTRQVFVAGNLDRTNGSIGFTTGTLTLDGATAQNVNLTNSTIQNLEINKTSGSAPSNVATLTNTTAFTWNGNLTLSAGTLVMANLDQTIAGSVTGAGSLTAPSSNTLTIGGTTWSPTGFTAGNGTVAFTGATSIASASAFYNLAKSTGGTLTLNESPSVTHNLSVSGGTLAVAANRTLSVTANSTTVGTTVSAGTLSFDGTAAYAGGSAMFTVSGTGSVSVGTGAFAAGAMTITSTAAPGFQQNNINAPLGNQTAASISVADGSTMIWNAGTPGGDLDITGNVAVPGTGTLNFNSKNVRIGGSITGNIEVYDLVIPNGRTLTPGTGTILTVRRSMTIEPGGNYVITNNPTLVLGGANSIANGIYTDSNATAVNLGTVQISGAENKTLASHLRAGSLAIGDATDATTLAAVSFPITVSGTLSGSGSLTAIGNQTIAVGGDFTIASFTAGNSTVRFNDGSSIINRPSDSYSFYNLEIALSAEANSLTLSEGITVSNALTLTQGTLLADASGGTHNIAGDWDSSSTNVSLTAGSSTVLLSSADTTVTLETGESFYNLTHTAAGTLTANSDITVTNALTNGAAISLAGYDLSFGTYSGGGDSISVTTGGTITASGDGGTIATLNVTTDVTLAGGGGATGIVVTNPINNAITTSGTVSLNGTGITTLDISGGTLTANGAITTSGTLVNDGTLAVGNNELNVGTTTTNTGSITLGTQTVSFTGLVTNTGGSITGGAGTLSFTGGISGGSLTASENDTFCGGNFSPASFTHNSGDLTLNGTATPVALAGGIYNNLFLAKTATATINASGTVSVEGTLDLNTNNTLAMAANPLSVTGTTDNAGSISSSGAGTQSYTALVTNTGDITGAGLITLSDGITGAGTLTAGSGGVTSTATATFTGGTLDINGSSWTQSAGDLVLGTLDTPAGSTISFTGSAAQGFSTNNQTVDNVIINMGAADTELTITGNLNQSANTGSLTLTQGTLVMGGNTLTLGADLAVPAAATLSFADGSLVGGARNISITGGTLTLGGTTSLATTGTFAISGTTGSATLGTGAFSTGAMSLTGTASFTQTGDNGALSFSQAVASLDVASGTSCTWDAGLDGGSLDITGNVIANGSLNFNSKNVRIGGTITGNITFLDLVIPNGVIVEPQASSSIRVLRHLTIENGGSYNHNDRPLTLGGGSITVGTFTDQNTGVNPLQNLGAVTLVAGGGATTKTLGSALLLSDLEIEANVNLAAGGYGLTIDGDAFGSTGTLSGSGSLTVDPAGNQTIAVGGDLSLSTVNLSGSTVQLQVGGSMSAGFTAGNSTVTFNGASNATMLGYSFHNLVMNMGAAGTTLTPSAGITVANSLTLTRGDFRAGSYTHNIAGDWDSSAAAVTWNATSAGTSTINLTSPSAIILKATDRFYNLTMPNANSATISGPLNVLSNLEITDAGGTLILADADSVIDGDVSGSGHLNAAAISSGNSMDLNGDLSIYSFTAGASTTLAGDWTVASFTNSAGTVTLDGTSNQSITTNNQSWYNLAIGTRVTGNTVTFTGELNVTNGAAGQGLTTAVGIYNIAVNDGGTVANNVTFANSGTLILNTDAGEIFTATGGLTATAPSSVSVAGTIETTGTDMALGLQTATPHTVILTQNTSLSTGTGTPGSITLGPVDGGTTARTLSIEAGTGNLDAAGQLGATNALASLTLTGADNANIQNGIASGETISLANTGVLTLADPEGALDTGTVNIRTTTGSFQQTGASRVDVAADFSIAGSTSFERPVRLVGNVAAALTGPATFGTASTIDSASGTAYSLAFTGNGTRNFNAAIGSATAIGDLSLSGTGTKTFIASVALDSASGDLTVDGSTGLVHFQDNFASRSASQTNGANPIRFDDGVTLGAGNSGFYGNVTLDGLVFSSEGPVQMGSGPVTDGDSLALSGGTVEIGGSGQYAVYAITDGSVDLVLSGGAQAGPAGTKTFHNTIGTGTPLLSITQAEGSGPITFAANVTSGNFTTLANASFGPMTLTASGTAQLGSNPAGSDTATLTGATTWTGTATWEIYAPLAGPQNLVLAGSGTKTFLAAVGGSAAATAIGTGTGAAISQTGSGAVFFESTVRTASGMVQADTAAPVTFRGDIVSAAGDTDSAFNANITLDGLNWTTGGALTIGNAAADTLTISGDTVSISTAAANEAITVNARVTGAQNLSLATGTATARLNAAVGFEAANLPLDLAITAGTIELAGASIVTDGSQVFTGPVGLFANTILTSNGAGAAGTISFGSSLDSDALATARSLAVNTAGPLSFNGAVGATYPLASITSDAAGTASITGGSVTTTGAQVWNDPLTIGADTSFESAAGTGTAILFASTLMPNASGSHNLVVDGGSAQVRFADEAGSPTLLFASVDVATTASAPDAILVEGSILASGDIDWGAALTVATTDNPDTLLSTSGQQRFAAAVVHSNGIIEAGSGGLDFEAAYTATAAGSDAPTLTGYDGGVTSISIAGDMSFASFTHFEDELVFNGAATQTFRSNNQIVANLRTTGKAAGNGLLIADNDIYQTGAARTTTIESGWLDIATNDLGWIADTNAAATAVPDSFRGIAGSLVLFEGTELRSGNFLAASAYTVSHTGSAMSSIIADGSVVFDGTLTGNEFATLRMTGAGTTLAASTTLGHLVFASGGTVELASDIELTHNLSIETGALDASPSHFDLELAGHWSNSVGDAGFVAREGEVRFTRPAADGPIEVRGSTSWYRFVCEVAGQTLQFERNRMQTFMAGGALRIQGASESARIRLTRLDADQTGDLDWVLPAAPDAARMWQIDLVPGADLELLHVVVAYSDARAHAIPVPNDSDVFLYEAENLIDTLGGEIPLTCYRWIDGLLAVYSYTEDSDENGRIDRIRVTAAAPLNMDFSTFDVEVAGYEVDRSKGTNGFEAITSGSFANQEFHIHLVEKPWLDTGATPAWFIIEPDGSSLRDASTQRFPLVNFEASGEDFQTPVDTVRPLIAYSLALPGHDQRLIVFSEPIFAAGGAVPAAADLAAASYTNITPAGLDSTMTEYLTTLDDILAVAAIRNGETFTVSAALNDDKEAATDYSVDPVWQNLMLPPPYYPVSTPANTVLDPLHCHSDLLVSREPATTDDAVYFVWPLFAKDSVTLDEGLAEEIDLDIFGIDGDTASSQTIGLVRAFDGSQWLRDQDFDLQARVFATGDVPLIDFDTNVGDEWRATAQNGPVGLWLPDYDHVVYSSITPEPNPNTDDVTGTPGTNNTVDYAFDASNPKIVSVSTLDFFFRFEDAYGDGVNRYGARLDAELGTIPADWYRRIRPFSFDIHDVTKQRGNVTILNNVINPTRGETTRLSYQLSNSGPVTITVYTLDGSVVRSLYRGTRAAGDWTAVWDGRNAGGRVVARGLYFIRIVGPQIDEIRKVMVVK